MRTKPQWSWIILLGILAGILALCAVQNVEAGHTGPEFRAAFSAAQGILPGSLWTPVAYFRVDDDATCDDTTRPDPEVNLISVTVTFVNTPGAPAGTPSLRPGDIAAIALAREPRSAQNGIFNRTGGAVDIIISMATLPPDSLTGTLFLGEADRLAADADLEPPLSHTYFVLVATSPSIRDSVRFSALVSLAVDNISPLALPGATFQAFDDFGLHVVNNIGDLTPLAEGITGDGIPLVRADLATRGEQGFYPPEYPFITTVHPDARATWPPVVGGRVPQLWPAGSNQRLVLGLELAGGYTGTDIRLQSLTLELISTGRRDEWLRDGIDNDGDQAYLATNGVDDDADGVIDNIQEGIDEDEVNNRQIENRNDDNDYYIDHPGLDLIWGPNPALNGDDDDPGTNGFFDAGLDFVYSDDGDIPGQLDAFDTLPGNALVTAGDDDRPVQKRLKNEDGDSYFDDAGNLGINFLEVDFPVGFTNLYDYGVDPIILDTGTTPGFFDVEDTVLYPGQTASQNLFGGDRISNDDVDYYKVDGWRKVKVFNAPGGFVVRPGPPRFVPYVDEIYADTGSVRFHLDSGDEMRYAGANGWPPSFPHLFPDNDVLDFNDDDDGYIDHPDQQSVADGLGTYQRGIDVLVRDVNGNSIFDGTAEDVLLYAGGEEDQDGVIIPDIFASDFDLEERIAELTGRLIRPLTDEEPSDQEPIGECDPDLGIVGQDDDGDGEREPFDIANGIDDDGDSADTDGDGYVDGLEAWYITSATDPLDFPVGILPVPPSYFVDEGIDEDNNYSPFGLGWFVETGNPTGALIDEELPNGLDDDGDGLVDEDLPNTVTNIALVELIDEEYEDGIDNDFDGQVDEDLNYVPMQPLVDEEILDYFVDEMPGPDVPQGVTLTSGRFDFLKNPGAAGTQGAFGPRFTPTYPTPSAILLGFLEFQLVAEGDIPLDEYYIDFNGNGVYDTGVNETFQYRQDECLFPGFDGVPTLRQGDVYGQKATPVDNDGDGEDNDGDPLTPPVPDGIDNDGDGLIDEGFNEDCGDAAFTFEDYESSGSSNPALRGFQVFADTNQNGIWDPADTQISGTFTEVISRPQGGTVNHTGDFPHTLVRISMTGTTAEILDKTDDFQYDFFLIMRTDDDDNDGFSTVKGLSYGDDWSVKLGKFNIGLNSLLFTYSPNMFPQPFLGLNPMPGGRPTDFELTKAQYGRFYMNDIIGRLANDGQPGTSVVGGYSFGFPFVDATSSYLPVLGLNVATSEAGTQPSTERLVSIRVNFENTDLEGEGRFEPSDLAALAEDLTSGVALFIDNPNAGTQGTFDYDIFNDRPIDTFVPINDPVWDEDPSDPIVRAGGHYVVLRPTAGVALPNVDNTTATQGYDFFIAIRTSEHIDYHDAFRVFVRDGDVRFGNSRNVVNTRREVHPIAANVPTVLTDLVKASPQSGGVFPIAAQSPPTAVIGLDMHDVNKTFNGQPSRLRSVRVYFENIPDASGNLDADFTPRDLLEVYWGPDDPLKQWSYYDPLTGRSTPYPQGRGRLVSNSGVALYRDMPNSDTIGAFDDPMDPGVVNPDTPILLSGIEDWDFLGGFTYNVDLRLDPPRYEGGKDVSPVDPYDADPYEPLPDSTTGVHAGDDFFVVIRTSKALSFGDDFRVGVRVEVGNGLNGTPPIIFYPNLLNSARHAPIISPPYSEALSLESLTTAPLLAPMVTITTYKNMIVQGRSDRQDASSDPFAVLGINTYDSPFGQEVLTSVRVELRSISGLDINELMPLDARDPISGVALYEDNKAGGIRGEFDPADRFLEVVGPRFELNYFADHPGPDGVLGTYDDPGLLGVYDEGVDEVFLDDGIEELVVDYGDTVVDPGTNGIEDILPGAPLYPMTNQPGVESQYSIILRPAVPPDIPPDDQGVNQGPDYFVVVRTSPNIDYQDRYSFRLAKDAIFFSSGRSFASSDGVSGRISTNVPTFLEDMRVGRFTSVNDRRGVIALHMVNAKPQPVTLRNLTLHFSSVGDNNFTFTDLAALRRTLATDGQLISGISVWRNTNNNLTFDYRPDNPALGDQFIPLAGFSNFVGDVANPYVRFSVTLSLDQSSPYVVLPPEGPLEGGGAIPEFFVVLKPSNTASRGDDFTMEIRPGDVVFGQGAIDSGESLSTDVIVFDVNTPPFFRFRTPEFGAPSPVEVSSATLVIEWTDEDPDDNAQISLFYFRDTGLPYPDSRDDPRLTLINAQPITEDPDGTVEDSYPFNVTGLVVDVQYRLLAIVEDGSNPPLAVVSGAFIVRNQRPTITVLKPDTDERAASFYTVVWDDFDPDSNALINLYLQTESTLPLSASAIQAATDLPEDPEAEGDTFEVPIGELLERGLLQPEVRYYVVASIRDGSVREGPESEPVFAISTGTITPVLLPSISITRPAARERVTIQTVIEWSQRVPMGDTATVELYWAKTPLGVTPGRAIDNGLDPAILNQAIAEREAGFIASVPVSSTQTVGQYVWKFLNDPGTAFEDGVPIGETVYIYAQITDEFSNRRGIFSQEPIDIDSHAPLIEITRPVTLEVVNATAVIQWRASFVVGNDAMIRLFWSGQTFGATPGLPIDVGALPSLPPEQLIVAGQASALGGLYRWGLVNDTLDGFKPNVPVNQTVYIYGEIRDDFGGRRGMFSLGQFRIDEHFFLLTEPAFRIPSATATEDEPFTIRWAGYSGDPTAVVALYRDGDRSGLDGEPLLQVSPEGFVQEARVPVSEQQFVWNVAGVPLGSFYIYGVVEDRYGQPQVSDYSKGVVRVGQVVGLLASVTRDGQLQLTKGGVPQEQPALATRTQIRNVEYVSQDEGMYLLDGSGAVYNQKGEVVLPSALFSWDVARDLEVVQKGHGFYILDAFGGIQNLKGARNLGMSYFGWDIARDLELTPSQKGYYVLDGFGGIHVFGDARQFVGPFFESDVARDLEVLPSGDGLFILDVYGGIHPLGEAQLEGTVYFGWDIARDLLVSRSGKGYYVLDGYGAIYGFGDANYREGPRFSHDLAQDLSEGRAVLFLEVLTARQWDFTEPVPDVDPTTSVIPGSPQDNWVLFVDQIPGSGTGRDIYLVNTGDLYSSTTPVRPLVIRPRTQDNPKVDGNQAVWNSDESGDQDIYMIRQLPDGPVFQVTNGPQNQSKPDISKGVVVWQDFDLLGGDWDIHLYDSVTGSTDVTKIVSMNLTPGTDTTDQQNPAIYTEEPDGSGNRRFFVVWEDNPRSVGNLDIVLYRGVLDATGQIRDATTVRIVSRPGSQFEPDLNFNRNVVAPRLVLVYTESGTGGDLNVFFETIDMDTLRVLERRTIPSAGKENPDVPVNVNPQFRPVVSEDRIAFIDRRSGFWDVYMSDFRVFSLRREEPDGEIRITDTRQRVTELATSGDKIVWLESEGGVTRLQVGVIEIQELPPRLVFPSAISAKAVYQALFADK